MGVHNFLVDTLVSVSIVWVSLAVKAGAQENEEDKTIFFLGDIPTRPCITGALKRNLLQFIYSLSFFKK